MKGFHPTRRMFLKGAGAVAASAVGGWITPARVHAASDPIVIGCQADHTGTFASWGYWIEKAARVAVERINQEGGIAGRPVRYVAEDSESSPATGARKMRRLVQRERADFVVGSVHSGVALASIPVARELRTPFFPTAMAAEITAERGNRWVFRAGSHVRSQVQASYRFGVDKIAKKWTIVMPDFAWGWSHRDWFKKEVENYGGTVLGEIVIPVGTRDFFPYLARISGDTEGIYWTMAGGDTLAYMLQLHELGYRGEKLAPICAVEAIDMERLVDQMDRAWFIEYLPRRLKYRDTPHNRAFRQLLGVDEEGREIGNPSRVVAGSHYWASYESVSLIKKGIEISGWKTRRDHPAFIEGLEGLRVQEGSDFPRGDLFIRAEDHQGFHEHWMSQMEKGRIEVRFTVAADDVAYPVPVDFRTEKL